MAGVVDRWREKLAARRRRLDQAERGYRYWLAKNKKARKNTPEYKRALEMLKTREAEIARAKKDIAEAERVIKRNSKATKISDRGVRFIAEFEGFSSKPYLCPAGVWTIGYGSTKGVGPNTPPITREQALTRLRKEIDEKYGAAVRALPVSLSQSQFDAVTSFVYNLGPGVLEQGWTFGRHLRAGRKLQAADSMLMYDKANGRPLPGLTRRRKAERRMFLHGDYSTD
jgi:lysozyme